MKVAIYTLGCKVNQYETQAMEQELVKRGHELVEFDVVADAYIVNTCTVTAVSDKKSRGMLRRARRNNENAIIAACGCYAQVSAPELEKLDLDLISGSADRMAFLDLLEQVAADKKKIVSVDAALSRRAIEPLPAGGMSTRTRAMLKIEDGCANFCSYCIIPYARGPVRSLSLADCVAETARIRDEGYREMVITGIEISSWGRDLGEGKTLIDAVEAIAAAAGDLRIRLGSLEPRTITEEFCRRAASIKNLCNHFHLSMQSGCDETLSRMKRRYDTKRYLESVNLLKEHFDNPAITTDLIVGFPGETEAEFAKTLSFAEQCGFAEMHIFPYSIRQGTPAAKMEQVEKSVKEERAHRAAAVADEMHRAYLESCVGKIFPALFEQNREEMSVGHLPNYMEVSVAKKDLHNQVANVRIIDCFAGKLRGELV